MVLPARIERATYSLGGSRSIQLSYESTCIYIIEPLCGVISTFFT